MFGRKSKKRASDEVNTTQDEKQTGMAPKQNKSGDRTFWWRHELKYRITESQAASIEHYIRPYLPLDRYSKLQGGGSYPIVSLYLDSEDLQLCRESMTGVKNRFKLRIRGYTDEPDYPCFFEIKRRMNTIILKSRARVMHHDIAPLLSGLSLPPQTYNPGDVDALRQFQLYMSSIGAGPVVRIRYMRKAYEEDSENRVRITFDRQLCYQVDRLPRVVLNDSGWQQHRATMGHVVLEIKFTNRFPVWISRMVRDLDLKVQSMSKYASSIEQACALGFCAPALLRLS